MNIDGISGGVSGLPESFLSQVAQTDGDYLGQIVEHKVPRACDSIWIMFRGKSIRLAFLSFGTEAELKRVCQNIYKYQQPRTIIRHKWLQNQRNERWFSYRCC